MSGKHNYKSVLAIIMERIAEADGHPPRLPSSRCVFSLFRETGNDVPTSPQTRKTMYSLREYDVIPKGMQCNP